jgi:hypothetical protein
MYLNGKMRPAESIPRMGERGMEESHGWGQENVLNL